MNEPTLPTYEEDTKSAEYRAGQIAFEAGESVDTNPCKKGKRYAWFMGWYDRKHQRWFGT